MGDFLTSGSTKTEGELKTVRSNTISRWEKLGFLDGLKSHEKENIAQLYECEASKLLKNPDYIPKNDIKGDS